MFYICPAYYRTMKPLIISKTIILFYLLLPVAGKTTMLKAQVGVEYKIFS